MAKDAFDLVIGLGVSGRSVIRYLADQGMPVRALDTRDAPAGLDELREQHPKLKIHTGGFKGSWMKRAQRLIVSPGVAVSTPAIAEQIADRSVLITGHPFVDIWQAIKPSVIGIERWPDVPKGQPWKEGVIAALGVNATPAAFWKQILGKVTSWKDLETPLLGAVEELIDFVAPPER